MNRIIHEKINGYSNYYSILDNHISHRLKKQNKKPEERKMKKKAEVKKKLKEAAVLVTFEFQN